MQPRPPLHCRTTEATPQSSHLLSCNLRIQPIKLWNAYRVPSTANRDLIKKSQNAMKGEANKRRGPSHLKPENYFKIGVIVRRINTCAVRISQSASRHGSAECMRENGPEPLPPWTNVSA
jgi:hypothetical protein